MMSIENVLDNIPFKRDISVKNIFKKIHPEIEWSCKIHQYKTLCNRLQQLRNFKLIKITKTVKSMRYYKRCD